ncbi:MAG: hypothetical protein HC901_03250 [Bdellovibrionaceae bacterium]|nr:hypothetical protein [Pseudobdellovibrionaceae bacterium]
MVLESVDVETVRRVAAFAVKRALTPDHWRQLHGLLRKEKLAVEAEAAVGGVPLPKAKVAKSAKAAKPVKSKPVFSSEIRP